MGAQTRSLVLRGLALMVVLELLLVPAVLFWPNFRENLDALRGMMPFKAAREMLDQFGSAGAAGYICGQQFFKACNTLGTAAAVLFAAGAIAGEAHRGTLEIWISRPISRRRLLLERWAGGALAVIVPVFATSATIPWLAGHVDEQVSLAAMMLCAAHQSALLLALYSATFFFSTLGSNPLGIGFGMLLFAIFQFAVYLIERVTHYSLFRLADIPVFIKICDTQRLQPAIVLPLLGASALLLLGSLFAFERRVP